LYGQLRPFADPFAFVAEFAPPIEFCKPGYRDDMARAVAVDATERRAAGRIFMLPAEKWARRISGVFGNRLCSESPAQAHAVLTAKQGGPMSSANARPAGCEIGRRRNCAASSTAAAGARAPPASTICPSPSLAGLCLASSRFINSPRHLSWSNLLNQLIAPYGGALVNLIEPARAMRSNRNPWCCLRSSSTAPAVRTRNADERRLFARSPASWTRAQCARVETDMQLDDGTFWPLPVTLGSRQKTAAELKPGDRVALRDGEGFMLAVLTLSDVWQYGDICHLGGAVEGRPCRRIRFFQPACHPGRAARAARPRGWRRVVAWQARQPMHRAHSSSA